MNFKAAFEVHCGITGKLFHAHEGLPMEFCPLVDIIIHAGLEVRFLSDILHPDQ